MSDASSDEPVRSKTSTINATAETTEPVIESVKAAKSAWNSGTRRASR